MHMFNLKNKQVSLQTKYYFRGKLLKQYCLQTWNVNAVGIYSRNLSRYLDNVITIVTPLSIRDDILRNDNDESNSGL